MPIMIDSGVCAVDGHKCNDAFDEAESTACVTQLGKASDRPNDLQREIMTERSSIFAGLPGMAKAAARSGANDCFARVNAILCSRMSENERQDFLVSVVSDAAAIAAASDGASEGELVTIGQAALRLGMDFEAMKARRGWLFCSSGSGRCPTRRPRAR